SDWSILDSTRNPWNIDNAWKSLWPNMNNTENTAAQFGDFVGNGFKLRAGGGSHPNISGGTYIYWAFAEVPFKYSNAR
ncbi:MAG: hypothetical protein KUL82_01600, partial [Bdellovibrio sp.]|nr:hypothetical protein [Bdellovibrio sp.]